MTSSFSPFCFPCICHHYMPLPYTCLAHTPALEDLGREWEGRKEEGRKEAGAGGRGQGEGWSHPYHFFLWPLRSHSLDFGRRKKRKEGRKVPACSMHALYISCNLKSREVGRTFLGKEGKGRKGRKKRAGKGEREEEEEERREAGKAAVEKGALSPSCLPAISLSTLSIPEKMRREEKRKWLSSSPHLLISSHWFLTSFISSPSHI